MHDLNTINKLNAEAHAKSVKTAQEAGLWVIAKYTGLHLLSTTNFNSAAEAQDFLESEERNPVAGNHYRRFDPIAHPVGHRDQSEDRTYTA